MVLSLAFIHNVLLPALAQPVLHTPTNTTFILCMSLSKTGWQDGPNLTVCFANPTLAHRYPLDLHGLHNTIYSVSISSMATSGMLEIQSIHIALWNKKMHTKSAGKSKITLLLKAWVFLALDPFQKWVIWWTKKLMYASQIFKTVERN